ncbi:MAG: tetratricopeptide repeat protein [Beijerinckiaceae bacterium]|nr:tetratricopeptide repeat protein [Beijerinckiaceae bacterium]
MSEFFREVDEEVRRERVLRLWAEYRYWLIAAAILLVAGTGAWRLYSFYREDAAQAAGAKFEAAMLLSRDRKPAEAAVAFDELGKTAPKGYASLARLRAADERAASDPQAAIRAFEELAAEPGMDPVYRDFAKLRAAMLRVDSDDPMEFEKKFAPLASDTFPYHHQVRELLGLAALKRNAFDTAANWFDGIVSDTRAPPGVNMRARALLDMAKAAVPVPANAQTANPPAGGQQGK